MVTSFLIGMGCLFLILGHSTLLFFKSKDLPSMPIRDAILPWPRKGRSVSVLCLGLAVASFFLILLLPSESRFLASHSAWKILVTFAVLPSVIYANYLSRRIRKKSEGLLYVASDARPREWSLPLVISAFVFVLLWTLN